MWFLKLIFFLHLTIILRNRTEYRLILSNQRGRKAELAKIRGYSAGLSRIIILLFNTLVTLSTSFISKKVGDDLFSPAHEITRNIAGYQLTTDDEFSVHHDHIWVVL